MVGSGMYPLTNVHATNRPPKSPDGIAGGLPWAGDGATDFSRCTANPSERPSGMGPPREFRLEVFQNRPGILPAPSLRPARASLPFCESYFSRGDFLGPPILAPPPRPPPGPPRKWNFFEKGGPLFSWLHRKIKSRQKSGSFWPAGSKAARNLAAFGRPAQQPPEIWQLLRKLPGSCQLSGSF